MCGRTTHFVSTWGKADVSGRAKTEQRRYAQSFHLCVPTKLVLQIFLHGFIKRPLLP